MVLVVVTAGHSVAAALTEGPAPFACGAHTRAWHCPPSVALKRILDSVSAASPQGSLGRSHSWQAPGTVLLYLWCRGSQTPGLPVSWGDEVGGSPACACTVRAPRPVLREMEGIRVSLIVHLSVVSFISVCERIKQESSIYGPRATYRICSCLGFLYFKIRYVQDS